jgi:hypothetical protein
MIRYLLLLESLREKNSNLINSSLQSNTPPNMTSKTVYLTKDTPTELTINLKVEVLYRDRTWVPAKITKITDAYVTVNYPNHRSGSTEKITIQDLEKYDDGIPLLRIAPNSSLPTI